MTRNLQSNQAVEPSKGCWVKYREAILLPPNILFAASKVFVQGGFALRRFFGWSADSAVPVYDRPDWYLALIAAAVYGKFYGLSRAEKLIPSLRTQYPESHTDYKKDYPYWRRGIILLMVLSQAGSFVADWEGSSSMANNLGWTTTSAVLALLKMLLTIQIDKALTSSYLPEMLRLLRHPSEIQVIPCLATIVVGVIGPVMHALFTCDLIIKGLLHVHNLIANKGLDANVGHDIVLRYGTLAAISSLAFFAMRLMTRSYTTYLLLCGFGKKYQAVKSMTRTGKTLFAAMSIFAAYELGMSTIGMAEGALSVYESFSGTDAPLNSYPWIILLSLLSTVGDIAFTIFPAMLVVVVSCQCTQSVAARKPVAAQGVVDAGADADVAVDIAEKATPPRVLDGLLGPQSPKSDSGGRMRSVSTLEMTPTPNPRYYKPLGTPNGVAANRLFGGDSSDEEQGETLEPNGYGSFDEADYPTGRQLAHPLFDDSDDDETANWIPHVSSGPR